MTNEERLTERYSGLDYGGKTGREWLSEFRSDLGAIVTVLDDWQQGAAWLATEAQEHNDLPSTKFSVPSWFVNITSIVALWCDSELHIDPSALTEFNRRMLAFQGRRQLEAGGKVGLHRTPMTDDEVEACLFQAKEVWSRAFHATLARATKEQQVALTATDARNKSIYDEAIKGTSWPTIAAKLKKKPKRWEHIDANGCRQAAIRYSTRNELPRPPERKPGRPKTATRQ